MTAEEVVEKIKSSMGQDVQSAEVHLGDAVVHVAPEFLPKVAEFLKDDPDLAFDYLSDIRGVDYLKMEREPRFEAVYELHSIDKNHSVRVRVGIPEENPSVPTVTKLWSSAVFPEREIFDMFGVHIEGLEDERRLIMPETWEGHPLRKDYPLVWEDIAFTHNRDFKKELVKENPAKR